MATTTLDEVLDLAQRLPPADRARLIELLQNQEDHTQPKNGIPPKRQGLRALRGLGKELWQQIDSTEYLRQERAAWDG